ncbi:MAG TPA: hypothetical protein PLT16_08890 [Daejeonella sp.]|nr:hypothetical protein [Daejeonella sp.]
MHTGFAISIAWPETLCKQAGAWYDSIMDLLGFSKNNYYKVGHSAVVLIEIETGNCYYFDFGRYHAPFGQGRVRDVETDHDLQIYTQAQVSILRNELLNFKEILLELTENKSCHGSGTLHASYTRINFEKAFCFAKKMQNMSPWKYGPFVIQGTNCSRFVRSVVLSGDPPIFDKLKLFVPLTISPSPIGNVNSLRNKIAMIQNH